MENTNKPTIFAYMRKSTTNKQEISLENQEDNIDIIMERNGINPKDVQFFSESQSAYSGVKQKNGEILRKRKEFSKMMKAIEQSKVPCIILVRDSSRLSRNQMDSLDIQKKLFGIH